MSDARKIGLEIFEAMPKQAPSVFRKDFWTGKVMEWSMRDEAFKLEMFRFVDVFPVLRTPEQVAGHLKEYFCRPEQDFPVWIRFGLESVSAGSLVARAAASQIERNIRGMAADFVAGEDAASALPKLIASRKAGIGFTVDLLGEATVSEEEADTYAARYADLIDTLADAAEAWRPVPALDDAPWGEVPRVNVSIKVSSLYSQLDPIDPDGSLAGVRARLLPLLQRARRRGVFVNLDMEQFALKELTLALFRSLVEDPELGGYPHLGVVLQAYLRSARDDARALCAWAKRGGHHITVRLVKGAYWDYETVHAQQQGWPIPVFQNKWESDASFEACAKILLDHYPNVRPAIASHNVRSIAAALAYAEEKGVPAAALEVQTLFGMADALKVAVQRRGVRVREYVPVGELVPGMAYLVRRLLENTSNEGFLRARFAGAADPETLLRDPAAGGRAATSDPTPESEFVNTPNTDFSVAARRESVAAAIGAVRGRLGGHVPLTIGPATVDTEARLERHNPARRSERIVTTAAATREHADQAIRAGYEAFPSWRDRPARERTAVIRRAGELIEARRDELTAWLVLEVGKAWREADAEVSEAVDFCRFYADRADAMMSAPTRLGRYPGESNLLLYQPLGVGAIIAPWNFPLAILCGMTVGAIVTGNCAVMKPAEQAPGVAAQLFAILREAGVPAGVVSFLPGRGEEVGAALVAHPWTRFVAFTGSRAVGLEILRVAGDTRPEQPGPKRVVCEMGGKNAIIVDADADLDEAVAAVVHSAFGFQGQKCSACSRVITLPENHDAFVGRLLDATRSLAVGPPDDPRFGFGPVIDEESCDRLRRAVARASAECRALLVVEPPAALAAEGHYPPLAIFDDVDPRGFLAQDEQFGPVVAILRARDFEHALELANGTAYALTGAVISRSPTNLDAARRRFRVGNLYLNRACTGALVYRQPFGGFKYSGTGAKAGGPNTLHAFVEERSISENTMRRGFAPDA